MTERERLIKLLKHDSCQSPMLCDPNCQYINLQRCYEERTADYLLENGVILPPVKIGQSIWTSKPFKDGLTREGYITVIEYDNDGFCGFWASFGEIPLSAEFSSEEIGETVFI